MQANDLTQHEAIDLDDRDVRALTEYLTVLPEAPDVYTVVSQSGESYTVDAREGACTCRDAEYRAPEKGCKHVRRVRFETGARELPVWVDRDALPSDFGAHVDAGPDRDDPDHGAAVVVADGGVVAEPDGQGDDECEQCAELREGDTCADCFIKGGKEWSA